ncbi:MAG: hypothetical protein K9J13_11785 [Saprospiraceae bacterium]|nr:hypothetical protein [Saprospiraceae bacterium]
MIEIINQQSKIEIGYYEEFFMKSKSIFILILIILATFSCYAEENGEFDLDVHGLDIYTLDNLDNQQPGEIDWSIQYSRNNMNNFSGFGSVIKYQEKDGLEFCYRVVYMENETRYYKETLSHLSFLCGSKFYFSDIIYFSVYHNFNYIEYFYEFKDYRPLDETNLISGYSDTDNAFLFSPSIDFNLGANLELTKHLNLGFEYGSQIWYLAPKFEFDHIGEIDVSEVYDFQSSLIISYKF